MRSINRRTAIKLTVAGAGALTVKPGAQAAVDAAQPLKAAISAVGKVSGMGGPGIKFDDDAGAASFLLDRSVTHVELSPEMVKSPLWLFLSKAKLPGSVEGGTLAQETERLAADIAAASGGVLTPKLKVDVSIARAPWRGIIPSGIGQMRFTVMMELNRFEWVVSGENEYTLQPRKPEKGAEK